MVSGILIIISTIAFLRDEITEDSPIKGFKRPRSYEEASEIEMRVEYGEERKEMKYEGRIGERILLDNEAREAMREAFLTIERMMLREGERQTAIRSGITIPERIEGNPTEISWEADRAELFLENGDIDFEKLEEATSVSIFVKVQYGEMEETKEYVIRLLPREITEEESLEQKLKERLDKELESSEKEEVVLPERMEGILIHYRKPKEEAAPKVVGGGILFLFLSYAFLYSKNQQKKQKREEELKESYAYFVGRFALFLGAGLTILSIWKKLSQDESFPESLKGEIKLTLWEIGNGKTEREAYENFGKRIGGMKYSKFVLILTENLRQGSSQIVNRLELEAREAMLERKNNIKTIGEKMGTKLLMPMMFELILIMTIIMAPALIST